MKNDLPCSQNGENLFEEDMDSFEKAKEIAYKVSLAGGRAYFVGGFVRDRILKSETKDIDIEVHGVFPEKLREILDSCGSTLEFGESFGIYSLKGFGIDIALPRSERATGRGHRDFLISVDPFIGTKKAAERRDFTVNSLMEDVLTGEITDHFGGMKDIENRILRHVNDLSFSEDALRVLRLAQFSARFGFSVAEETKELCRNIDLSSLSRERVEGELKKALLQAGKPSVFFEVLREIDGLRVWFSELEGLIALPQNPVFHPEGDVWVHTMQVLDRGAEYRDRVKSPYAFMLSALCHDFGKITSTREIDGALHSYNHESEGLPIAEAFLSRITNERDIISYVLNMVLLHMKPGVMVKAGSSMKAFNRLFDNSVCPEALIYLSLCDGGHRDEGMKNELFERLGVFNEIMSRPFVQGRDLIEAGFTPCKEFSEILKYAHKLRLAGIEKESALKQTLTYAEKL